MKSLADQAKREHLLILTLILTLHLLLTSAVYGKGQKLGREILDEIFKHPNWESIPHEHFHHKVFFCCKPERENHVYSLFLPRLICE